MSKKNLVEQYLASRPDEKTIVLLLALYGEPLGKTRLLDCLRRLGMKDGNGKTYLAGPLAETMSALRRKGFVTDVQGSGFTCAEALRVPAIRSALAEGSFESCCDAIEASDNIATSYDGEHIYLRSYRQGLARLRMALLRGQPPEKVYPWVIACSRFIDSGKVHPYVEAVGRPFEPDLFACLHPALQEDVMAFLLDSTLEQPETAPPLHDWAQQYVADNAGGTGTLAVALAQHWLICGRLDEAESLLKGRTGAGVQFMQASILLLRGEHNAAASAFDAALKALRKEAGKRNVIMSGQGGYFYVLAMMRSDDPKFRKLADTYLELTYRVVSRSDFLVYRKLHMLRQVQAGTLKPEAALELEYATEPRMLPLLFQALLCFWLGLPPGKDQEAILPDLVERAESAGFYWVAAQAAELLHRQGDEKFGEQAALLRKRYGLSDMCDWFERQEPWQRQLSALMELRQGAATAQKSDAQSRLIWLIAYEPRWGSLHVEPREQKRDARGNWTKGRAVALKRLREDVEQLGFLTQQDKRVVAAIDVNSAYYGLNYDLDEKKATLALIGHPLVFWRDAPDARVEMLRGEPELLVKENGGKVQLSLQPPIDEIASDVLIVKETPTRLRIFNIGDEHRRIAAIIGNKLTVPTQAKEQVLQAVSAISSLVTIQSDIGGGAADAEQVEADRRLHVHLLPYDAGLKAQILVKPFTDSGPAYAPGQGAESLIAEVGGKRLQARRDLSAERKAEKELIAACPILDKAEQVHGEWLLDEPQDCLELLQQLQQRAEDVVIAWPEGEKFRVSTTFDARQMRLTVKSERDWFAAGGELRIDDDTVLDLRKLLELVQQSQGRFVALEGNRFLALTEEFHRRLSELSAFGDMHGKGVRVHPLAAFALEDLAEDAGTVKTDQQWKQHLQRVQELDAFQPQLPNTLQAELRDYQVSGFNWLARLAQWGVGACLADDMGLGKTVQTIALLLSRAPQGPALVVAPTSVCMNWMSEIARFAPTLNAILFGSGDRSKLLSEMQAFDVIVVSYGLLQQEAELFAGAHWHTIVLDEAQAIKNAMTKRSQAVMALTGDFRMAATGTPLENHLGELWNLFRFINPGLLGSLERFNERFAQPIERQQDAAARTRLRRLIQPFILRRTKAQVLSELPARIEIVRQVELSKEEAALYEVLRHNALEKLAQDDAPAGQKSLQILAEIMKLRRACCNPQLVAPELGLSSSKLAAFAELLDELLENRHKALVFSQFVDHLNLIRAELDRRGVLYQYLDGATPMQERKKRVDAFQAGEGDVFLISLKAGGTGLNLTAADYVIHMDPWWNPAVEDQASDRAHRMGQQRPVTIYRLVARHTIEESIVDLHKHKRDLADSLLEGSDAAGKMSAQEMLGLLQKELLAA